MTVDDPSPSSSYSLPGIEAREKTYLMETDSFKSSPHGGGKKQTSLLSFFSSPSPKRPVADLLTLKQPNSPSKKKACEETLLATTSSFYEMISEDEELEQVMRKVTRKSPFLDSDSEGNTFTNKLDLSAFLNDDSMINGEPTAPNNTILRRCKGMLNNTSSGVSSSSIITNEEEKASMTDSRENVAERYSWLVKVRDADGRLPDDVNYDPRTLYIPKSQWVKFTPFEKQFWEIKSKLFDTVVFFKKGKFYELYENDADIGAREFDLKMTDRVNMRMVGVPEATFEMWAARFVAAGYKIARVDQTENAIGKSIREKETDIKAEKIIRRELSCILTAGTVTEPTMIASDSASYCIAIKERLSIAGEPEFGIAIIDAATGSFKLSDFKDDPSRTTFETLLMQLQPKEVLIEKGNTSQETRKVIKNLLPSALFTEAISEKEFWSHSKICDELDMSGYFSNGGADWPETLRACQQLGQLSFLAFGALVWYLRELKLDKNLLSYGNISSFDPVKSLTFMVLDGQTLLNLDVIPSSLRSSLSTVDPRKGTLLSVVDHCTTPFGRRLLHSWVCHPLCSPPAIDARLDVIDFFLKESKLADQLTSKLRTLPDLERTLSRIHSGTVKLKDFMATTDAFKLILEIPLILRGIHNLPPLLSSEVVEAIPDYTDIIQYFDMAFDRQVALKEGQVIPYEGVEEEYDRAQAEFSAVEVNLQKYLHEQERILKIRGAKYRDVGKEIFQLEVPAETIVPKDYILMSKTKAAKRYWTAPIKLMVKSYQEWEERRAAILRGVYGKILKQFDESILFWRAAVSAVAKLDCLLSLAKASDLMDEPKCRPVIIPDRLEAICDLVEVRHPCVTGDRLASFISNDVSLGADSSSHKMILLTGPNMGGKSTLLRQTCLAVILAQLGCYVTAKECRLSPVDRIFTRLGANDNIIAGQSTFMVELLDTAKILREATPRSLVILDELGRGTSTFDGMAIAHAVLLYLARVTRCIGLFATHYRPLAVDFMKEPNVDCQYMSCALDTESRRVTFLYKLSKGISPKSYGMNVAAMAGISPEVIDEADRVADRFESSLSISLDSRLHSKSRQLSRNLVDYLCLPDARMKESLNI